MAFGDSNDIKLTLTLDTQEATKGVEQLKSSIKHTTELTKSNFLRLAEISKNINKVAVEEVKAREKIEIAALKNQENEARRKHERELAQIQVQIAKNQTKFDAAVQAAAVAAQKEVDLARIAANEKKKLAQVEAKERAQDAERKLRDAQLLVKKEIEHEKTERVKAMKEIADVQQETAKIRKGPREKSPEELAAGAGKLGDLLKVSFGGISTQIGGINVGLGTSIEKLLSLGGVAGNVFKAVAVAGVGVVKINEAIARTAEEASKIEGISTAFRTLQQSIGNNPTESIEALRAATRGLISDTQLYQRANQAVLLGVPTKVFNEAAGAAVKLGRAMGIDAAFGLESLSLGLGRQSRLYLDNLGIVVSAEEAYAKFALTVGSSAQDLTDAEKKAAFFAEALAKIKQRADELPEPFDTVGVSLEKLQVAQENNNKAYLEAFNSSKALSDSYQRQAEVTEASTRASAILGAAVGKLVTPLRIVGEMASLAGTGLYIAFAEGLNALVTLAPEDKIADLNKAIAENEERVRRLAEENQNLSSKGPYFQEMMAKNARAIANTNEETKRLQGEIINLGGSIDGINAKTIKPNIDLTSILEAQAQFKGLFKDLREDALESVGIVEIPGFSKEEVDGLISRVKQIRVELANTKDIEKFKSSISSVEADVSEQVRRGTFKDLQLELENLNKQYANDKYSKDYFQGIANITAKMKAAQESAYANAEAQKALGKAFVVSSKQASETTRNTAKEVKKAAKEVETALEKEQKQLEQFRSSLESALKKPLPENVQKQLVDAFNDPLNDAEELIRKIDAIGQAFIKSGGSARDFIKEAGKLKELKLQDPTRPIQKDSQTTEELDAINEKIKEAQEGVLNIRDILFGSSTENGKKQGGGFFGFDTSELFSKGAQDAATTAAGAESFAGAEAIFAKKIVDAISFAVNLAFEKFTRQDAPEIGAQIGSIIFGEAGAIGGKIIGEIIARSTNDLKSTRTRKNIDKYFSELFDGARLSVIVGDEVKKIEDLVFEGNTLFAGPVRYGGENFKSYFQTVSADIQATFTGVGVAFGSLLGLAEEESLLIGTSLLNNIGGSLNALKALIEITGKSLEEFGNAIIDAFTKGKLSIDQAYNSLLRVRGIFDEGLPGVGDFETAGEEFKKAFDVEKPGQLALTTWRTYLKELEESGKFYIEDIVNDIGRVFGLTQEQTAMLLKKFKENGINNINDLLAYGKEGAISFLQFIKQAEQNIADITPIAEIKKPEIKTPSLSSSGRSGGKSAEEIAREELQKFRDELFKTVTASKEYESIIAKLNRGQLDGVSAGKAIIELRKELARLLRRESQLEKDLREEQDKGRKANKARLAELAKELQKIQDDLKKIQEGGKKADAAFDFKKIVPFIRDVNNLGVVARSTGVSLESATSILTRGFLQGRISLAEFNKELKATKDNLGPGIPKAVGAVSQAFKNLVDAGVEGGQFSVDAFNDIFVEFREKFNAESSKLRESQGNQLRKAVDDANAALLNAVGPESIAAARETLNTAEKALKDFYDAPRVPNLSDLRSELEKTFPKAQEDLFFRALDESSINSFGGFETAGQDAVVGILARLSELGFEFGETSQDIKDLNKNLNEQATAANGGVDAMKGALDLIKAFNDGAKALPPAFNETGSAIAALAGPLSSLSTEFSEILDKLSELGDNKYENTVIFNVKTQGDEVSMNIAEILFGDGTDATVTTGDQGASDSTALKGDRKSLPESVRNEIKSLEQEVARLKNNKKKREQYRTARRKLRKLKQTYGIA